MTLQPWLRPVTASALAMLISGVALAAQPMLEALRGIETGQWELKPRGAGAVATRMCVTDPVTLIQLRHPGMACSQFVVTNEARSATVHYTCPGAGHGRTSIRTITPRSLAIETQGIASGAPFHVDLDAHRIGTCPTASGTR